MAKWDFKIVGASFVKELVPVDGDVQFRSQSFMQPSFDLEGDKIVMKESGAYKTAIVFSQIGTIDGVAPTDIEDAYAKLLTLVENFNRGGGTPVTTPKMFTALLTQSGVSNFINKSDGILSVGVTYLIADSQDGDWTNVGAPNNNIGTYFIATGITPNNWGSGILSYDEGAPTAIVLENTVGNVWFEYSAEGLYSCKSFGLFTSDKTTIDMDAYCQNGNPEAQLIYKDLTDSLFTIGTNKTGIGLMDDCLSKNRLEIKVYNSNTIQYEPEYLAVLLYATLQGFTLPSTNQNNKNNTKIKLLKEQGIFSELDLLYNFKQPAGLEDFCRINWVNPGTYDVTQSNPALAPTFEADKGFKGTGSTYFSTNYIPLTNATNAIINDMGAFFKTYDEAGGVIAGTRNGAGNNFNIRKAILGEGAGGNYTALCSVTNDDLKAFNDASHIVHAKNGTTHSYYVNGVFNTSATYASTTLSSVELTLFAWNLNGGINQFFTGGIEYFGLGSSYVEGKAAQLASIFSV